jgi:PAS domain S-box-containing protein
MALVKHAIQTELKRRAQQLRLVTDNVSALIAYIDADQRYCFANETYREWFGVSPEQVIGHTLEEVLGPVVYARAQTPFAEALAGHRVTYQNVLPGAGERHAQITFVPDTTSEGVRGVYVVATDITRRVRAEQELWNEKERVRATLESIGDAVLSIDVAGRIVT